jgi:hypothetical protein
MLLILQAEFVIAIWATKNASFHVIDFEIFEVEVRRVGQ